MTWEKKSGNVWERGVINERKKQRRCVPPFFHCHRTAGGRGSSTTPLIRTQVKFKYLLERGQLLPFYSDPEIFSDLYRSQRVPDRRLGQAALFAIPPPPWWRLCRAQSWQTSDIDVTEKWRKKKTVTLYFRGDTKIVAVLAQPQDGANPKALLANNLSVICIHWFK